MAVHDLKSQRLFLDASLVAGQPIDVTREQANYLLNVLRLDTGSTMLVYNGRDGEWSAEISVQGRKKCTLTPIDQHRAQPSSPSLIYCFAPLKQGRLDYMVQKAVEMGAGVLQPVITQHTQVRNLNQKRLSANVIEASEQCGILSVPEISDPVPILELREVIGKETHLIMCDEASPYANPNQQIAALRGKTLALLVGPEGGFSEEEREVISSWHNVTLLGLGPRILRADTAAVAALALVQTYAGDWYQGES